MAESKDGEVGAGVDSCHCCGGGVGSAYRPTYLPIDLRAVLSLANMPSGVIGLCMVGDMAAVVCRKRGVG